VGVVRDLPSVMWFARWGVWAGLYMEPVRLYGKPVLQRSAWAQVRRIHPYAENVCERHGDRTLVIDRNLVDAPVARIG
jgi:hypothetical protein